VLQVRDLPEDGKIVPFVSDFFDFSIYIDAEEARHPQMVCRPVHEPPADRVPRSRLLLPPLRRDQGGRRAGAIAESLWENINLKNLRQNILPTRPRADLILRKAPNHLIEQVALRKL
jgi:type I pantothenate kinase